MNCHQRDGGFIYSLKVDLNLQIYLTLIAIETCNTIAEQKHELLLLVLLVHH